MLKIMTFNKLTIKIVNFIAKPTFMATIQLHVNDHLLVWSIFYFIHFFL